MKNVLLTNEDFIKSISNISDNISGKFLLPAILESQNEDLRGVIGTDLLNKLIDLIDSNEIGRDENAHYALLIDKCQYFLAYSAISKMVLLTSYKLFNEILAMKDLYINKADYYKYQLQLFLLENTTKYPELNTNTCNSIRSNIYNAASSGLWLGGVRGKINRGKCCGDYDKH